MFMMECKKACIENRTLCFPPESLKVLPRRTLNSVYVCVVEIFHEASTGGLESEQVWFGFATNDGVTAVHISNTFQAAIICKPTCE